MEETPPEVEGGETRGLIARFFGWGKKEPEPVEDFRRRLPVLYDRRPDGVTRLQATEVHRQRRPVIMRKVIVESPFKGRDENEVARNRHYAREACHDCVRRGENPFASHLFYTQFLNDNDPAERAMGIQMGLDRWNDADAIIFYLDFGLSGGMQQALYKAFAMGLTIERRFLRQQLAAPTVAPGLSLEQAFKNMHPENPPQEQSNAQNSDTRADRREDSDVAGERPGVDLQRA